MEYDVYSELTEEGESENRYGERTRRNDLIVLASMALLALTLIVAVSVGMFKIPFMEVIGSLVTLDVKSDTGVLVWRSRLPRALAAIIVGAGLSLAGAVMQCILRNPLASPYTLGISSASAFGAAVAIIFITGGKMEIQGILMGNAPWVTISAFAFCMIATLGILALSKFAGVTAETMVLAGIAISAIFTAGLTLMQYMADSVQLSNIVSWTFGNLGNVNWGWDFFLLIALILAAFFFTANRWTLNAIDAGDDVAKGLGVNTARFRLVGMVIASTLASLLVAGFGIMAFIGLLGPHIARMIVGSDHRHLVPVSMTTGAIVLLVADTVARNIFAPMVLPVGILTSLLGGPLFIALLIRRKIA